MSTPLTEWRPLGELRTRIDQLFRDLGDGDGLTRAWSPSMDIVRGDEAIVLRADLPGIEPDEVRISARDGVATGASLPGETSASYAVVAAADELRRHFSAGELDEVRAALPGGLGAAVL